MPRLPNRVGEEPKSESCQWTAVPGACRAWSRPSDGDRCTIDSEFPILLPAGQVLTVGPHSFPVDTQMSLAVDEAATLDQTAPPIDPFGTVNHVCRTWPVCSSSSTPPPRMSGSSRFDAGPT